MFNLSKGGTHQHSWDDDTPSALLSNVWWEFVIFLKLSIVLFFSLSFSRNGIKSFVN